MTVAFSTASLSFDSYEGQEPVAQTVSATATGSTDKEVLMSAELTGKGIATPINVSVNAAARTAAITVLPERGLAAGTYSGTIKLLACAVQDCSQQHAGSPHTVAYTVAVRPGIKLSSSSFNLAAPETGSATGKLTFTPPAGTTVNVSVGYESAQTGWLVAQAFGNTVQLQASAGALPVGTYAANVTLRANGSDMSATVPVKLTVSSGLSVSAGTALKVDSATTVEQLKGTIPLTLTAGATARTWTAVSDQAWLVLTPATGNFTVQPGWRIDPVAFSAKANNTHHLAKVKITTDVTLPAQTYTLDVHKAVAELKGLDGQALLAGQSGNVYLYGSGFDSLASGTAGVDVAGTQASSLTRLSDNVMRLSLPTLQAGSYAISLKAVSGMTTADKSLVVTTRDTYSYQALDSTGLITTIVWDAASKSVFVVNATQRSVQRYALVSGSFALAAERVFDYVDSIAMTSDRTALVLLSGTSRVYKLSPADLTTIATFTIGTLDSVQNTMTTPLTITGDNQLLHPQNIWVDLSTGATAPATPESLPGSATWGAVSGNGLRMMRPDSGLQTPKGPMYHLDLLDRKFTAYPSVLTGSVGPSFSRYAVNHDGAVWSLDGTVVDFALNIRGKAELPAAGWMGGQSALSRDGTRLYVYAQGYFAGVKPRIYVYDTTRTANRAQPDGSILKVLPAAGYIEFDDLPNCLYSQTRGYAQGCYTTETQMTISEDDQALFLAGDTKVAVVPIPAGLRAAISTRQSGPVLGGQTVIPAARH